MVCPLCLVQHGPEGDDVDQAEYSFCPECGRDLLDSVIKFRQKYDHLKDRIQVLSELGRFHFDRSVLA